MFSNDTSDLPVKAHDTDRAGRGLTQSEAVIINGLGLIVEHETPEPEPVVRSTPKMSKRARARLRRLRRQLSAEFMESRLVSRGGSIGS